MKLRTLFALLTVFAMTFYGCGDDGGTNNGGTDTGVITDTGTVTDSGPSGDTGAPADIAVDTGTDAGGDNAWADEILPMLQSYCAPCHNAGATPFLTDASSLDNDAAGTTDPACAGQKVSECIHTTMAGGTMPLGKSCPGAGCPTQDDIDAVKAWLDSGAAH